MRFSVIGITKEVEDFNKSDVDNLKTFSGKQAGICYMKDRYFGTYVSDDEKALKRFSTVASVGHHSISDHTNVTVLFEGISKFTAMVLNSLSCYATSEKSGRYTEMHGGTDIEEVLYVKWKAKFQEVIKREYPKIDGKQVEKLAMENARYFISIFSKSTTMSYTTSLRQWNYIYDWCVRYESLSTLNRDCYFDKCSLEDIRELKNAIYGSGLYVEELRDFKNRHFRFLATQTQDCSGEYDNCVGSMYTINYEASFAYLAQAQRHRTLKYYMHYVQGITPKYYIPPILNSDEKLEWLADMDKVSAYIPQGMLVCITECGELVDFLTSKCSERFCGRAQLEIAQKTEELLRCFRGSSLGKILKDYWNFRENRPKTKCELLGGCKEPCVFGAKHTLDRLI